MTLRVDKSQLHITRTNKICKPCILEFASRA